MTSGTAGNETPHFDLNGNETGTTINGGTWVDTYDDEDRLTSVAVPGVGTDTFTYNGLGLRVGKVDSTGTYSYVCDGTTPGSPILSDGHTLYTPGLSERRNGSSLFYNSDDLGNLWAAEDGTGQAEAGAWLFTGFGAPLYTGSGSGNASPLKYGGANGCQTDYDTGLVLMGHRYYDVRTGRFISQDPAGDGDNWYAYADNSPTNAVDPDGLVPIGMAPSPFEMLLVGATTASQIFGKMDPTLAQLGTLSKNYQFFNVYLVTSNKATGKEISRDYQFSFAVPFVADIWANYRRARGDRQSDAWINRKKTEAYFRGNRNGIAQHTPRDYKDKAVPAGINGRIGAMLHQLLDNGGNFNGGMVAEGYGTLASENWIIGTVAKSESEGRYTPDDAVGQRVFSTGWQYGQQIDH